jgi:NodT family efflux transporter outer membrane factor (OMF) lipoprotein
LVARPRPDSTWWTVFGDSALNRLVGIAHRQNLSLQTMGLRILQARAQLAVAVGRRFPQVQALTGSATATRLSENTPPGRVFSDNYGDYQLGFDVAWEPDFWGRFRYDVQAQSAGFYGSMADYDNALVSLTAEVARTYAVIRTNETLIGLARKNARLQEEGLKIAQARYKAGATSELDVVQATTLLQSTLTTIPQLEIGLIQAENALATLLGQPTGTVQGLLQGAQGIPVAPAKVSVSVPADLLLRRPDIRAIELQAVAQTARVGIAKSEMYPRFVLFGSIGLESSSGVDGASANLFDPGSLFFALGPRMVWPLFNYGRLGNSVRVQDARLQQALVEYQSTVLKAAQEVEDGIAGFLKSREALVTAQAAAASSQRAVDIGMIQYREGAVDFQRVLEAERSLLDQENTLAQVKSSITTNLISLYKAMGGGWEMHRGRAVVSDSIRLEMQMRTDWGKMLSTESAPAHADTSMTKGR